MFQYSIVHPPSFSVDESRIEEIFRDISIMVDEDQIGTINIAFVPDEEMQKLNLQYRGKDTTTDVLSFHYYDDVKLLSDDDTAGEILMSESRIATQVLEHGHSEREEFEILLIHGVLHILGFDHETDEDYEMMWEYEKPLREKFELSLGE